MATQNEDVGHETSKSRSETPAEGSTSVDHESRSKVATAFGPLGLPLSPTAAEKSAVGQEIR